MLYTKHVQLTDATETTLFTVPTGFHAIIYYVFVANHAGSTKEASLHFAESDGSNRVDIYDAENVSGGGRLTLDAGGGPMFVLHEGEVVKVQTEASSDMEFVVTFDLLEISPALVNFV
tara:strand:- start:922 stop:1275 length:354 start_codon:yes stop_codon:yes gene_type:complete